MVLPQDDPALRLLTEANGSAKFAPALVVKQSSNGDDTAPAQAALDKCRDAGGGEVVIPYTGTTWRLGKLTIYRNTTLRCQPGVVIKRKGTTYGFTNYDPAINPLTDNADPYSGHGNIKIIGGTWDGNLSETYVAAGFDFGYFIAGRGFTFDGMTIKDTLTNHAFDLNGVADVVIRDCNFLGFKDTTVAQTANYVEAIQYSQNLDEAMPGANNMLGAPSTNLTIDNCVFGPSGTAGTQSWPTGFGNHTSSNDSLSNDITITGNTFNGQTFAGLALYTYNDARVIGNRFSGCAFGIKGTNLSTGKKWNKTTGAWDTGLGLRMETRGLVISGNYFVDTTNTDVSVLGTMGDAGGFWATCNDITISGNIMKATTTAKRTSQNIRLLLCKDAIIANNQCNNASEGILVDTCPNVGVQGNRVNNTALYGIRMVKSNTPPGTDATYATNNRASGNTVTSAGTHGIGMITLYFCNVVGNTVQDWGTVTAASNGILVNSSTNGGLVSSNSVRATATGLGGGIALGSTVTNVAVTYDNRIVKADGQIIFIGTGAGNTYGNLVYTVG